MATALHPLMPMHWHTVSATTSANKKHLIRVMHLLMAIIWSNKFDLSSNMNNTYRLVEYCMYIYRYIYFCIYMSRTVVRGYVYISAEEIYCFEDMIDMHICICMFESTCVWVLVLGTTVYCIIYCTPTWYYPGTVSPNMLHRYFCM